MKSMKPSKISRCLSQLVWGLLFSVSILAYKDTEKTYDFDFKEMDVRVVLQSVARLMNRYVVFAPKVDPKVPLTLELREVTAPFAFQLVLESQGLFYSEKGGVLYITNAPDRKIAAQIPAIIPMHNIVAKDIEKDISNMIGKDGKYSINEQKNAYIITAEQEVLVAVKQLISELDQEVSQIHIEAKIVETSKNFAREFGTEWGQSGIFGTGALLGNLGMNVTGLDKNSGVQGRTSIGLFGGSSKLDLFLKAAESNGKAKIISSPQITTLNGTSAKISSQSSISIKTPSTVSGVGGSTQTTVIQSQKTQQLSLDVTPTIVGDNQVRLSVVVVKSDAGAAADAGDIPPVLENNLNTSFIVHSGQTAGIAGLTTHRKSDTNRGTPFLSSIPILGALFGSMNVQEDDRELLVFMTPRIYKGANQHIRKRRIQEIERDGLEDEGTVDDSLNKLHGAVLTPPVVPSADDPAPTGEAKIIPNPVLQTEGKEERSPAVTAVQEGGLKVEGGTSSGNSVVSSEAAPTKPSKEITEPSKK